MRMLQMVRLLRLSTLALALLAFPNGHFAQAQVIDHLNDYNGLAYNDELNGIGQTFVAPGSLLLDASLLLNHPPEPNRDWWTDAHFEVRVGVPGALTDPSKTLFRSDTIDLASVPVSGTAFDNSPLRELRLSNVGYATPVSLTPGATYSLLLVNDSNAGDIFYADNSQNSYSGGGYLHHFYTGGGPAWWGPSQAADLAFKVVTIPEPSCSIAFGVASVTALMRKRIRGYHAQTKSDDPYPTPKQRVMTPIQLLILVPLIHSGKPRAGCGDCISAHRGLAPPGTP